MRYDLTDLKLFLAIAHTGNLSRASSELHLTPSAASYRLRNLEAALGLALFTREHRGMRLTEEGHVMLDHVRRIFGAIDAMERDAVQWGSKLHGKVTLAANSSSLHGFISPHIGAFLAAYPDINISLVEQTSETIPTSVAEGEADLGVYAGEAQDGAIRCQSFARDELVVIVPQGHALSGRVACRFQDTLAFPFVGMGLNTSNYAFLRETAKRYGRTMQFRIHSDDFPSILRLVADRVGIAIVPRSIYMRRNPEHPLDCLSLDEGWARRHLWLVQRDGVPLSPAAALVHQFLLQICPDTAPQADLQP